MMTIEGKYPYQIEIHIEVFTREKKRKDLITDLHLNTQLKRAKGEIKQDWQSDDICLRLVMREWVCFILLWIILICEFSKLKELRLPF